MSLRFETPQGPFKLKALAEHVNADLYRQGDEYIVHDLAPLSLATADHITILHQRKYIQELKSSQAGVCILSPDHVDDAPQHMYLLVHHHPYKAFALIAQLFYPLPTHQGKIESTAYIAPSATIGKDCYIAHGAYIGEHAHIGEGSHIGVNTYIGDRVSLGSNCIIENNVSIKHTRMGDHVRIYPGACIGQDGFGFASDTQGHYKIPHVGGVIIGNHVEIGANTCIDRGSLNHTVIEDWCRLDNLVQIGHNVTIGAGAILCGQVGVAGSSKIGRGAMLAGKVGISGHVKIGEFSTILSGSGVRKDVPPHARFGGYPAVPDKEWHRQQWILKKHLKEKK